MAHYLIRCRRRGVGDVLSVSALVRDLAAAYPDIRLSVPPGEPEDSIYAGDPRVVPPPADPAGAVEVVVDHKAVVDRSRRDRSARYCHAGHEAFEAATGIPVPRGPNAPSVVLAPGEAAPPVAGPYGVVVAGVKSDAPLKQWPTAYWAELVRSVPDVPWVQLGRVHDGRRLHRHPVLPDCKNLLGLTPLRKMLGVIASASVVACHVSLPMLAAAAFGVPCVAVGGGREDPWLFEAPGLAVLHTVGQLLCCAEYGCRRASAVRPHADSDFPPNWLCALPVVEGGDPVGECMRLIPPAAAATAVKAALGGCQNR